MSGTSGHTRGDGSRRRALTRHWIPKWQRTNSGVGEKVQFLAGAAVRFATAEAMRSFSNFRKAMGSTSIRSGRWVIRT